MLQLQGIVRDGFGFLLENLKHFVGPFDCLGQLPLTILSELIERVYFIVGSGVGKL